MADEQQKGQQNASGQKPDAAAPAKPAAPKPPAAKPPAKEKPGPKPHDDALIRRLRARFGNAIGESTIDRDQVIVIVAAEKLLEACEYLKAEERFDYLADLTAVDFLGREKRFEVLLNLYSMEHNQRVRVKVLVGDDARCPSVTNMWGVANWLERECYDMFGIVFEGHPDLRRILLPEEWKGYPLRKDYDILKQDDQWVQENLGIESGQ